MARGQSNIVSVILLVSVALACAIVVGLSVGDILNRQTPRGASVSAPSAKWYATRSSRGYTYYFDLTLLNSGTEVVTVTHVVAVINGTRYTLFQNVGTLKPNEWIQLLGSVTVSVQPTSITIPVEVGFCTSASFCSNTVAYARMENVY